MIRHSTREFRDGKCHTNKDVDPAKRHLNYSLIRRGDNTKEIEMYRKSLEKEIFHYKRKNLVHAIEVVCTMPTDCPASQEHEFMEESLKYVISTIPMGEKAVFLSEVHHDEAGQPHLHVMFVPASVDTKHEGYQYRLCADELTKRSVFKNWHANYQRWLDEAGVRATVVNGATSGRGISVKSLKELREATGYTLEQIHELEQENEALRGQNQVLTSELNKTEKELNSLREKVAEHDVKPTWNRAADGWTLNEHERGDRS